MAPSVNSFRIKRQAHTLSRQNSGWSPFGHIWQLRTPPRRETWDVAGIEAQNEQPRVDEEGNTDGEPIHHAATAPSPRSARLSDDADERSPSRSKEHEAQDAASRPMEDSATAVESQHSTAATTTAPQDGLRNRRENGKTTANGATEAGSEKEDSKKNKKPGLFKHVRPKTPFTVANQIQRTVLNSWINILLLAAPVGIALNYVHSVSRIVVFVVNFIAIIPLAAMLSFATEEIALRTGETLGGLLNATFGYVVRPFFFL